ncbi:MAG: energy-coupling factor transporter transmembrane component T [Pseudomonadota bacterium]
MRVRIIKGNFIEKNVLSFFGVFSNLRREKTSPSFLSSVNPIVKFLSVLVLVLSVSLSGKLSYVLFIGIIVTVAAAIFPRRELKKILTVAGASVLFAFIIMLPSVFLFKTTASFFIVLKIAVSVLCVNVFVYSTNPVQITQSLKVLFVPDVIIFIVGITVKHIVIVGDTAVNMLLALKKKTVGEFKTARESMFGLFGVLFIKSKNMSESMYDAMVCRGFNGEYKRTSLLKLGLSDYMYIALILLMLFSGALI